MKKLLAVLVFGVFLFAPKAQATFHSEWQPIGQPQWSGVCNAISTTSTPQVCGTQYRGVETGVQEEECVWLPPKGKIECRRGQTRTTTVTRSCSVTTPTCPVPPTDPTPPASSVRYSQGPDGHKGDNYCQLEYHKISGSSKVEVRYAEDKVFGNGYKSFITEDDGAIDLKLTGNSAAVKIRGRDSKGEWSDTKNIQC